MKGIKITLLIFYCYFSYLLLLITLQYLPLNFEVTFLKLKLEEVKLGYYNIAFFTHVYTSVFLLFFGILQFSKSLRNYKPKIHRLIGKLYILIILLLSGPASLIMGFHANGGIVSKVSFVILSILWLIFTYLSFYHAKRLNFKKHQQFAIRSFALTLSAISLRLFKYIIVFLWHPLPMDTYRVVSWLGWLFNLLIAEIIILYFIKKNKTKMELKLNRPICFFDLETTGIDVARDRIVEISVFKVYPNGNKESKTWLVNPTIPIPPQTTAVHGITDEKVANEPTFNELASQVYNMIKDSDLAGFNSDRFDIPLLAEEMLRAGVDFDMKNRVSVDIQTIFHKKEERTLSAGYKFYCGESLENAHSAEADTMATYEILKAQLDRYPDLENDIKALSEFTTRKKAVDFAGFIVLNKDDKEIFSFGKHKGILVEEVLDKEPGYFSWLQNADFPLYTKKVLTGIKLRKLNTK